MTICFYFCIKNFITVLLRYTENIWSYDHYIDVKKDTSGRGVCSSYVGMVRSKLNPPCNKCQQLTLWFDENNVERSCAKGIGTVIHEFLHALGKLRTYFNQTYQKNKLLFKFNLMQFAVEFALQLFLIYRL